MYTTSIWEFIIAFLLILTILIFAYIYQIVTVPKNPIYKYYTRALSIKLFGSFCFFLIYGYYYPGGDTTNYFEGAVVYGKLLTTDFELFLKACISPPSQENLKLFRVTNMIMADAYWEEKTNFVIKFFIPVVFLANNSFLISTLLTGLLFFFPVWSFFKALNNICPSPAIAFFSCFLIPSTIFWVSGMSKDTITFGGLCLFISHAMIYPYEKSWLKKMRSFFFMFLGFVLILNVKPYVVIGLIPAFFTWKVSSMVKQKVKNVWLKILIFPTVLVMGIYASYFILTLFGESLDKFALDRALETAAVTQQDLKRIEYQGQSFDIGEFKPELESILPKIPIATFAGLFYPLPGHVNGAVPNISTLENSFFIALIIYMIYLSILPKGASLISDRAKDTLTFFLVFSITFAFIIGLSTSNFGALVRFRAPMLPMFSAFIFVKLYYLRNRRKLTN